MSQDWKSDALGNVATLQRGFDLPARLRKPGAYPIVTSSGIEQFHAEAKVKGPGVVTGRYGTIGKVFFVREDFWPLNTTLYVRDFHENDPQFVSYLLRTIDFEEHSGKTGVPGVNRNDLHEITIFMPQTCAEQEGIAGALSDADALIESIEQLLAKKRQLKQGAMQELLTGKKRLSGFRGQWELRPLRAFVRHFVVPMRDKPKRLGGEIPWCRIEDFDGVYLDGSKSAQGVDSATIRAMNLKVFPTGTLLISCSADLGRCAIVSRPLVSNQTFIGLEMDDAVSSNLFFYYYMTSKAEELNNLSSGTTISYLSRSQFEEFGVFVPLGKDEQVAIANVLNDMDAEIATLEAKLAKARQLKQGMMQELLTGRIRLV